MVMGTHNMSTTKFYKVWRAMHDKCENTNNPRYHRYGGRNIIVCEEWFKFEIFMGDMYEDYKNHISNNNSTQIDRINNNGIYSKNNCRWVTAKINANNRGMAYKQRYFLATSRNGETFISASQVEFAKKYNLVQSSISRCLNGKFKKHKGWTFKFL